MKTLFAIAVLAAVLLVGMPAAGAETASDCPPGEQCPDSEVEESTDAILYDDSIERQEAIVVLPPPVTEPMTAEERIATTFDPLMTLRGGTGSTIYSTTFGDAVIKLQFGRDWRAGTISTTAQENGQVQAGLSVENPTEGFSWSGDDPWELQQLYDELPVGIFLRVEF